MSHITLTFHSIQRIYLFRLFSKGPAEIFDSNICDIVKVAAKLKTAKGKFFRYHSFQNSKSRVPRHMLGLPSFTITINTDSTGNSKTNF